ncbi:MAG TPA: flagellar brake protein [Limnobacter sp.]|nr:flagellar brake protein [Limnobacter sp.]
MDNSKELSPLAKGDIEIGKALPFPIFDRNGVLLLAEGQAVQSQRQLDELAAKGLYHNPRWGRKFPVQPPRAALDSPVVSRPPASRPFSEDPFETGTHLKMLPPGQAMEPFFVRLIGSIPQQAILVTHPTRDGQCIFCKEGQVWDFQATYGLSIYRFSSMIEKVLLSPHPLLVLSWPQETHLEVKAVRSAKRVNCELPATLRIAGDQQTEGEPLSGVIDNISTGGFELRLSRLIELEIGQQISIAFQILLDERKYLLETTASVVSRPRATGQASSVYGFVWKQLQDEQFAVIHACVSDRLNERLGPQFYA